MISADELSRLWRENASALALLARTRCQTADDCVQEAFIRLAKQATPPNDPVAWLARVVRNESISQARSKSRRQTREQKAAALRSPWFAPNESSFEDSLPPAEVQNALERMQIELREIVVAHIWNGMTFRQIEQAFDIPRSTIHRRYTEALEQLRHMLGISLERDTQS